MMHLMRRRKRRNKVSKILVDVMPMKAEECPFAEYIGMTSKNACRLKSGMYSRCDLECGKECEKLIGFADIVGSSTITLDFDTRKFASCLRK